MDMEKKIKKVFYIFVILALFILVMVSAYLKFSNNDNKVSASKENVVAVVDGFKVYEGDISARLKTLSPDGKEVKAEDVPQGVLRAMVLEVFVNNEIDKDSKKLKYQKNAEIEKIVENFKRNIIREKYLNDTIFSKITDKEVENEYAKIVESVKGKEERKIKHILVADEDEIERIRRNVLRSGNFEKVAKEKSIDKTSAENGGDIGYVLRSELVPEFADVAFILKAGAISKPLKTQYGWHIIKVEDIRPAQFLPFDEVKDRIKQKLQQEAIQKYLTSLTSKVNVDFKIDIKKLPIANLDLIDKENADAKASQKKSEEQDVKNSESEDAE